MSTENNLQTNIIEKTVYAVLGFSMLVATYWAFFDKQRFADFVQEDSVAEYATAAFFGLMAILCFKRFLSLLREKSKLPALTWFGLFLMTFFVFGEEISWGQRIFNIQSGEFFKEFNTQDETNLHNLKFKGVSINRLVFSKIVTIAMGIYFLVLPFVVNRVNWLNKLLSTWNVPMPKIHHTIALLFCTFVIMVIPVPKNWELWEMAFSFIFFLVLYRPFLVLRK